MATMREASQQNWTSGNTGDDLKLGCLQRIADATEKMAGNFTALQSELTRYKGYNENYRTQIGRLIREKAALRGVITKLKGKL